MKHFIRSPRLLYALLALGIGLYCVADLTADESGHGPIVFVFESQWARPVLYLACAVCLAAGGFQLWCRKEEGDG